MKSYLNHSFSPDHPELISVIDELPLWSAPFGLKLLDLVEIKTNFKALDVGCGLGFPLIEMAQRLGETSTLFGLDPWQEALNRVNLKIKAYSIKNVEVLLGKAENMPFENQAFDLLLSNNGSQLDGYPISYGLFLDDFFTVS